MSGKRKPLSPSPELESGGGPQTPPPPSPPPLPVLSPLSSSRKKRSGLTAAATSQGAEGSTHRPRPRREPLPMKLRALPESFWQQPNTAGGLSPGAVYPVLPPLCKDGVDPAADTDVEGAPSPVSPVAPPAGGADRRVVSAADTELLFSLFRAVEQQHQPPPKVRVAKRGRPRKVAAPGAVTLPGAVGAGRGRSHDDDPCLPSAAADALLPLIAPHRGQHQRRQQQVLAAVSVGSGESPLVLPELSLDFGYSHILSELVMRL